MNDLLHKFDTNYILNQPSRHRISPANTTSNSIVKSCFPTKSATIAFEGFMCAMLCLLSRVCRLTLSFWNQSQSIRFTEF